MASEIRYDEGELRALAERMAEAELPRLKSIEGFGELPEDERLRAAIVGAFVVGMRSGLESARRAFDAAPPVSVRTHRHSRVQRLRRPR